MIEMPMRSWSAFIVGAILIGACPAAHAESRAPAREASPKLVHYENFAGAASYDTDFWRAETGFFRNKEAQYYLPANVEVRDGMLSLIGKKERVENSAFKPDSAEWPTSVKTAEYSSGSIVTRDSFHFGIFEVVARLPQSLGAWPAIWTIWETGLPYREIDIVEAVGVAPGVAFTTVSAGPDLGRLTSWKAETKLPDLGKAFHTYRLEWRPEKIAISIDGREVLKMNPEEARKNGIDPLRLEMRLRINLALGGSWGGAIDDKALPARLDVKSVKIWRFRLPPGGDP